jgi:hypothetical protein
MTTSYENDYTNLYDDIQQIQQTEQTIINDLNTVNANNLDYQKQLVDEYNNLESLKAEKYTELKWIYDSLAINNSNQVTQYNDQITELELLDKILQEESEKLAVNKNLNIGNLRMSEISTYYSEKYRTQSYIVKNVIFLCLPLLILVLLKSKDIISNNVFGIGLTITLIVMLLYIIPSIIDIYARDNMVFSEYNYTDTVLPGSYNPNKYVEPTTDSSGVECVGSYCCTDGMYYDNSTNTCKDVESFVSGSLTGSKI